MNSCCWQLLAKAAQLRTTGAMYFPLIFKLLFCTFLFFLFLFIVMYKYNFYVFWSVTSFPFGTNSICGAWTAFPARYGLYCVAHFRPCAFCTSFIPVNHIRPHATFSCYLVLMLTAVMREEMREWWMVIVVLLLLNIWPGTILAVFSHGTLNASLS